MRVAFLRVRSILGIFKQQSKARLFIFITFTNKMMQKRSYLQEAQRSSRNKERENEGQRFKYLTGLPEFSNVVENSQSMRHLGSSEISLLQEIGQNERISDSTLFDENREKSFDTKVVEEIRFSFNNLEKKEQEQKGANHGSLTERYRQEYVKATADIANQNQNDRAKQKNLDIEKIKSKYLGNQQKEERNFLKKIEVQQKYQSKIFHDLDSFSKQNFSKKLEDSQNLVSSKNVDIIFQKVLLEKPKVQTSQRYDILPISKQPSHSSGLKEQNGHDEQLKTIKSLGKITTNSHVELHSIDQHCFEALFEGLDRNKTGKIDKQNCQIDNIREQFQLIFGVIFYRIKFNLEGFNKKQFVSMCYDCLKLLSKDTAAKIASLLQQNLEAQRLAYKQKQQKQSFLKELMEKQRIQKEQLQSEITIRQRLQRERQAKEKAQRQKIMRERQERDRELRQIETEQARGKQERLNILKEREERERQLKIYEQKYKALKAQENMILEKSKQETRCQNCKFLTKDKPSESPPKEKPLLTSRQINQSSQLNNNSHNKRPYITSKEAKHESNVRNNDQPKQSQMISIKILKEKENLVYKYAIDSSKNEQRESMKQSAIKDRKNAEAKREKTKNQVNSKQKVEPPKKKRNISEEILREHKRSLQELHKLNDKVDEYISHVPDIEQLAQIIPIQTKLLRNYESSYRQALGNI